MDDAQSLSAMYRSSLQYEQYSTTSFVPTIIEHLDRAADAESVATLADRWSGICSEIAEHVYAEYQRKPVSTPISSDYMHGVTAMIIGLRAKMGAQEIISRLQRLRALCKETMSSNQAALHNKAKLYLEVRGLCKFALTAANKKRQGIAMPAKRQDYHHQFASPRQRAQLQESYDQLVRQDEAPGTENVTPKRPLVEAQPEAVKKPNGLSPTTHFGPSLASPRKHTRSTSAAALMTPPKNTIAAPITPHRTLVHLSKQSPMNAASAAQPSVVVATVKEADVPDDKVVVVVPNSGSVGVEAMPEKAETKKTQLENEEITQATLKGDGTKKLEDGETQQVTLKGNRMNDIASSAETIPSSAGPKTSGRGRGQGGRRAAEGKGAREREKNRAVTIGIRASAGRGDSARGRGQVPDRIAYKPGNGRGRGRGAQRASTDM